MERNQRIMRIALETSTVVDNRRQWSDACTILTANDSQWRILYQLSNKQVGREKDIFIYVRTCLD